MEETMLNRDPVVDESIAAAAREALTTRKISFAENYQSLVLSLFASISAE